MPSRCNEQTEIDIVSKNFHKGFRNKWDRGKNVRVISPGKRKGIDGKGLIIGKNANISIQFAIIFEANKSTSS